MSATLTAFPPIMRLAWLAADKNDKGSAKYTLYWGAIAAPGGESCAHTTMLYMNNPWQQELRYKTQLCSYAGVKGFCEGGVEVLQSWGFSAAKVAKFGNYNSARCIFVSCCLYLYLRQFLVILRTRCFLLLGKEDVVA